MRNKVFIAGVMALATVGMVGFTQTQPVLANGNNGTVKIKEEQVDPNPNNDPHVPCTFNVEWYGFDTDAETTVTFESVAPTANTLSAVDGDLTPTLESDAPEGLDFDGDEEYTLSFTGNPQPEQGYHVKMTVETTDSTTGQNADVKHKTFWVGPCEEETAPDLDWAVICDVQAQEAVITVSNTGNAAGEATVNGEVVGIDPDTSVERRIATGENGVQVTIVIDGETVYDKVVKCVPGRGAGITPGTTSTPAEAKVLPVTSGDGTKAAIVVSSVVALAGAAISAIRRFVLGTYL